MSHHTHSLTHTVTVEVVSMQLDSGDRQQRAGTQHVLLIVQPVSMSQ